MGIKTPQTISLRIPTWTCVVLALSIISYCSSSLTSIFIYDRYAILNGEIWRLLSSHFVHFSGIHLFYNILAIGITGWIIEYKKCRLYWLLCLLMAFFIGLTLIILKPCMTYYGGLSGLACGSFIYLLLHGLRYSQHRRFVYLAALVLVIIKIVIETFHHESILPYLRDTAFVTMPLSHIIGGIVALSLFFAILIYDYKVKQHPHSGWRYVMAKGP